MKNKIYNLIASLASLVLGVILLVCVCLAWYVNNTDVQADGVKGIISEGNILDVRLTRYIAEEKDNSYIKKNLVQSDIKPYDSLLGYTKIIYEITFTTTLEDLSSLQLSIKNTNTARKDSFDTKTIDGNTYHYNYLSNVAVFKELVFSNGAYTIVDPINDAALPYSGQSDTQTHLVNFNRPTVLKSGDEVSIALLFDFNTDNINQLYTANLGSTSNVRFEDDIEFILKI